MTVKSLNCSLINFYIFSSVTKSMLAVASSIMMIWFFLRIALTMQMSCLSPDERLLPPSSISKLSGSASFSRSSPSFFSKQLRLSKCSSPASIKRLLMSSSATLPLGSMLNLKVPEKRLGS